MSKLHTIRISIRQQSVMSSKKTIPFSGAHKLMCDAVNDDTGGGRPRYTKVTKLNKCVFIYSI